MARYAHRAGRLLALFVALALLVGAAWLGTRHGARWQWTTSGAAALSDASRQLAERLAAPVKLTVALPESHLLHAHVRRLAEAYQRSHAAFTVAFVDPKAAPQRARSLGLSRPGEALLSYGERTEHIAAPSESRISAGLERLLRRNERFVAVLSGHGERDLLGDANFQFGRFGRALERKGYQLQPLPLASAGSVPGNASLVIVAGPDKPLTAGERKALRDYVATGGALLWLAEPGGSSPEWLLPLTLGKTALEDPQAARMLGVDNPHFLLLRAAPDHLATRGLEAPLILVGASAITPGTAEGWSVSPLLQSSVRKGETGRARTLAVALRQQQSGARAAVVGDSDLLANSYLGNGDNLRFGLQLIDWLSGEERFIGSYVGAAADQRLNLGFWRAATLAALLLIGLPCLLAGAGLVLWWRQRRE